MILMKRFRRSRIRFLKLIQALFGSISVTDFSLNQDIYRIFRIAQRISKCVLELFYVTKLNSANNYETFINLLTLHKCINCRLWYDSPHIFRQFNRIGLGLSQSFVRQSITSFDKVLELNQFEIERRLNKNSPFGTIVIETVKKLPEFRITCEIISLGQVNLSISLLNFDFIKTFDDGGTLGLKTPISLIIGDEINNLVFTKRIYLENFLTNTNVWTKRLYLNENINGSVLFVSLVFLNFVGLDIHETFEVFQKKNLPEKTTSIPTYKKEEKQRDKKSKEIQLKLTRSKSKNMSLTQNNKRKIESESESVEPKVPKQDSRIITFEEHKKQTENVEQPRLFKFRVKNKENIENNNPLNSNKDFENKKERNARKIGSCLKCELYVHQISVHKFCDQIIIFNFFLDKKKYK
ncbi:putative ATP-dependent DNA helicase HFM1 [Brachionus plicatilis]|uniref:Putative ATP-dependent DNA helicase HFM1 n=1 Tax=Brachionus plicatilis TaxID=10195 RepID=A0A3M7S9N0_BRAPC|nr:putative ATP-dependent DNA helicase HFM1 [Brachionus plicatilis]